MDVWRPMPHPRVDRNIDTSIFQGGLKRSGLLECESVKWGKSTECQVVADDFSDPFPAPLEINRAPTFEQNSPLRKRFEPPAVGPVVGVRGPAGGLQQLRLAGVECGGCSPVSAGQLPAGVGPVHARDCSRPEIARGLLQPGRVAA